MEEALINRSRFLIILVGSSLVILNVRFALIGKHFGLYFCLQEQSTTHNIKSLYHRIGFE